MCDYTYILILKGIISSTHLVNRFEIPFSSGILHHIYGMFYRVLLINDSKTGNTNSFTKTQFMVQRIE